uniref:Uncharacterized protein n=1 Tax=Coccolithus braarudii TaxID=221442 RepID=A0A7S0L0P9_9EUKA|mmetsp:Transcript_10825/g.23565  ORF Transcript_10825/g.23565 Transcript_10825/m.23565 type:complete len:111 (+) Transcript_10825:3-335(+)
MALMRMLHPQVALALSMNMGQLPPNWQQQLLELQARAQHMADQSNAQATNVQQSPGDQGKQQGQQPPSSQQHEQEQQQQQPTPASSDAKKGGQDSPAQRPGAQESERKTQ